MSTEELAKNVINVKILLKEEKFLAEVRIGAKIVRNKKRIYFDKK